MKLLTRLVVLRYTPIRLLFAILFTDKEQPFTKDTVDVDCVNNKKLKRRTVNRKLRSTIVNKVILQ